jgi:hypothetical protein
MKSSESKAAAKERRTSHATLPVVVKASIIVIV